MVKPRTVAVIPLAALLVSGCAVTHTPRLTAAEATQRATAEAKREHINMHQLMPPKVFWHPEDRTWMVRWDERPDKAGMVHIGGDYSAEVEDGSANVTIIPGR
jgi:hypothetical protein